MGSSSDRRKERRLVERISAKLSLPPQTKEDSAPSYNSKQNAVKEPIGAFALVRDSQWWWGSVGLWAGVMTSALLPYWTRTLIWYVAFPSSLLIVTALVLRLNARVIWRCLLAVISFVSLFYLYYRISLNLPWESADIFQAGRALALAVPDSTDTRILQSGFWLTRGSTIATCSRPEMSVGADIGLHIRQPWTAKFWGNESVSIDAYGKEIATVMEQASGVAVLRLKNRGSPFARKDFSLKDTDLSYLLISATLDPNKPSEGDEIFMVAVEGGDTSGPQSDKYTFVDGTISAVEFGDGKPSVPDKMPDATPWMRTTLPFRDGYCGAPVLNKLGKVIGIVSGADSAGNAKAVLSLQLNSMLGWDWNKPK